MNLHQGLKAAISTAMILYSLSSVAATKDEEQWVEVHHSQDALAPYKERRSGNGVYFGLGVEALELKNYLSTLDDGVTYGQMFGDSTLDLLKIDLLYKLNFSLGSLSAGVEFGSGKISDTASGVQRSLEIQKMGLNFRYTLDMIMDEPYVAPYVGLGIWRLGIKETSPTDSFSGNTQMGYNYSAGLLLQLDWIDNDTAKSGTLTYGLENTFLDVYATQYAKTESDEDPNTETDFLYGAGLRFEF